MIFSGSPFISLPPHFQETGAEKLFEASDSMPLISYPVKEFRGSAVIPGDKSISIRFFLLAALAEGTSEAIGVLESEDSLNTVRALQQLGVKITKQGEEPDKERETTREKNKNMTIFPDEPQPQKAENAASVWQVVGVGKAGFQKPEMALDLGNSGTGCRLLMGILASQPFSSEITGDASLQQRPMARILTPLSQMGCFATSLPEGRLPVRIYGQPHLKPIEYCLPVPSAQLKSALLLAGLQTQGEMRIEEPVPCRKHTESMLAFFGVKLSVQTSSRELEEKKAKTIKGKMLEKKKNKLENLTGNTIEKKRQEKQISPQISPLSQTSFITLKGPARLTAQKLAIPSDPSSAAFPVVAALLLEQAEIELVNLLEAPERTGFLEVLKEMGAQIERKPGALKQHGMPFIEKTFSLRARSSSLKAVHLSRDRIPAVIDELPILSVAAAFAEGVSKFEGLTELRFKESDRLEAIFTLLQKSGVKVHMEQDTLDIEGCFPKKPFGNTHCFTQYDHRLAMSALIMGAAAQNSVSIDDGRCIATSFPNFLEIMQAMGTDFRPISLL